MARAGEGPPAGGGGARQLAATVLCRVWQDGAYAAAALDAELRRHPDADPRDVRLCTELVYGVLRTAPALTAAVARHAKSDRWRDQPSVRAHLLIAAYSLLLLDRIPSYSAVSEAVSAITAATSPRVGGFANAVLRRLATADRDLALDQAVAQSLPPWLRAALDAALGPEQAQRFACAGPVPAPLCLALRAGEDRTAWLQTLASEGSVAARPSVLSPRAIALTGAGDPRKLPGFGSAWRVQEEGAQAIAFALGALPGERILDACAGRGGKALLLAELVTESGAVDAADRHPRKLAQLRSQPGGAAVRATVAVDWTRGKGPLEAESYDRVLIDAPCSGVGTLRRRPEIAARLKAADVARLAELQLAIARRAATCVRSGGHLLYAVCSVLGPEAGGVAERLTALGADDGAKLCPAPLPGALASELAGGAASLRLLPQDHGCDGYFLASFTVTR